MALRAARSGNDGSLGRNVHAFQPYRSLTVVDSNVKPRDFLVIPMYATYRRYDPTIPGEHKVVEDVMS